MKNFDDLTYSYHNELTNGKTRNDFLNILLRLENKKIGKIIIYH